MTGQCLFEYQVKQQPANLSFDPRQVIGYREVAALLGVSERTLRAGGKEYRELLARSFWLGKFRRWQAGFIYQWIEAQQRAAIVAAESAEYQTQQRSNVISIKRRRAVSTDDYAQQLWQEVRDYTPPKPRKRKTA